jgi:hypothetical protein
VLKKLLIRGAAAIVVLAGLGVLFVRSARDVRTAPYSVPAGQLATWTLTLEPATEGSGYLLSLRADPMLTSGVFKQIFARAAESMSAPSAGAIPLVLNSEFDRAMAGRLSPDDLLQMARAAGLDQARPEPVCLALRRISEPNVTRQVYFVLFTLPALDVFRRQVAERLGPSAEFDEAAQSPVVLVAASDAAFERWLPIRADAATDCTAPIVVQ